MIKLLLYKKANGAMASRPKLKKGLSWSAALRELRELVPGCRQQIKEVDGELSRCFIDPSGHLVAALAMDARPEVLANAIVESLDE